MFEAAVRLPSQKSSDPLIGRLTRIRELEMFRRRVNGRHSTLDILFVLVAMREASTDDPVCQYIRELPYRKPHPDTYQ
jgi:hypothetical protein